VTNLAGSADATNAVDALECGEDRTLSGSDATPDPRQVAMAHQALEYHTVTKFDFDIKTAVVVSH
jgi:hypothetical protein